MQTNSFFINKIISFFALLNKYFEYSFIYKICVAIGHISRGSLFVGIVRRGLCEPAKRDYIGGSFLLRTFVGVFGFAACGLSALYKCLANINEKSVNKALFDRLIAPLSNPVNTVCAGAGAFSGMFLFFAGYLAVKGYSLLYFAACLALSFICFYICFFISENILNAVKNSAPYRIIAAFFSEEAKDERG